MFYSYDYPYRWSANTGYYAADTVRSPPTHMPTQFKKL
jgi:hypothetical protein